MELKLPISIATRVDLGRLVREISSLHNLLDQAKIRHSNETNKLPALSRQFNELVQLNNLDLSAGETRQLLINNLTKLQSSGLQLHISFASEPSAEVLERIVDWFRKNVDPLMMLQIGLQPNLAAGCMVRTPNKVFDLSLRSYLEAQEPFLMETIKGVVNGPK